MKKSFTYIEYIYSLSNDGNSFLIKWNVCWMLYQTFAFFPMIWFSILRFRKQIENEEYYDKKKKFPSSFIDFATKIYTFFYFIFYVPELYLTLHEWATPCKLCYIIHHLATLFGAWNFMWVEYYPWFTLFPLAFHSLLIMFPSHTWLNYIYISSILFCYYGLMQKPYVGRKHYDRIKVYIIMLTFPLIGLWFFTCTNYIHIV